MLVRNATTDDISGAAAAAAAAYINDEQDRFMFPNRMKYPQRYLETKKSIVRHGMRDPTATVIVAVLEEGDEGWSGKAEIMGFCIWYRDDEKEEEGNGNGKKEPLLSRIKFSAFRSDIVQYVSDLFDPLVSAPNAAAMARTSRSPSSKHYFTSYHENSPMYGIMDIAVHPRFQKRGVARRLVEWGMKLAREEGVPIELSATPSGSGLYKRLGFRKVGVWRWKPGMDGSDGLGGWEIMRWEAEDLSR